MFVLQDKYAFFKRWLKWHTKTKFKATKTQRADWSFRTLARKLRPGDVAVDCGANIGKFTALLASSGATVHAFEPDPWAYETLQKRFAGAPNVVLHQAAVGDHEGEIELYRAPGFETDPVDLSQSSSVIREKSNIDPESAIAVRMVDFVEFVKSLDARVSILKMDIEGAEFAVLKRLLDADMMNVFDNVFVETHDQKIPELAEAASEVYKRLELGGHDHVNLDWR